MNKFKNTPSFLLLIFLIICGAGAIHVKAQYNPFPAITVPPVYKQHFEMYGTNGSFIGWTGSLATNDVNWRRQAGPTPSTGTGPSSARDGASYMYVEASLPTQPQSEAVLASPIFNLSALSYPVVSFWYHMNGTQMGTLRLEYSLNYSSNWTTVSTISGNRGPNWVHHFVNLPALNNQYSVRFRLRATTGSGWSSDIAVDRFWITDRYNKTEQEDASALQTKVETEEVSAFPNPFAKELNVIVPEQESEVTLALYNLQGQRLVEKHSSSNGESIQMNTQGLPAGTYILKVSAVGLSKTLRLVHQ